MSDSLIITKLLNSAIQSIKTVIPLNFTLGEPKILKGNIVEGHLGVLVGMTGSCKGQTVLKGPSSTFSQLAQAMFGMPVENEILISFTGELGNMIAGNLTTFASEQGIEMDITPPTVFEGNTTLHNIKAPIELALNFEGAGEMSLVISVA
ncbi:chemotaxis protein CheX [Bacillus sp. EAC]|uniref:chemotaxis protein CheX n=1 Tax=Bacillus sp. EAC TaxID=1978338 RepID=UPI000B4390EE|nr:chemotaxis protein CheX [Bacillus sp. EAC]